jgi:predicted nucleic acid-binding protein
MLIVIDTSVLLTCNNAHAQLFLEAISLLGKVRDSHSVVVDFDGHIEEEYRKKAVVNGTFAQRWWDDMCYMSRKVNYVAGGLTAAQRKIADSHACDRDDYPFLGVACRSGAPIVHEDGDYEQPGIVALNVQAHRTKAALQLV